MTVEHLKWIQKRIIYLLYVAMFLKLIGEFVPVLAFVSAILVTLFFIIELFMLDFKQLISISVVVGVLFYLMPAVVGMILGMITASIVMQIIAGVICYACSAVIVTLFCGVITSVEVISVTAPATIAAAITTAVVAASAAVGASIHATVHEVGNATIRTKRRFVWAVLGNLLAFVVVCWPVLSYTMTITGALACKPAVVLNQAHFHHLNQKASQEYKALFMDEKQWEFGNNFYHDIIRGTNNNITQGEKDFIAGDDQMLVVLLNGVVHIYDDEMKNKIQTSAYLPRETDAMLISNGRVFIFGRNKIFVCGAQGEYTWKETKYTSDFLDLSWEEQCEKVYDILERQNTEESLRFSYDEVGVAAYAQRNGLLLNYNRLTHTALFTQEDKGGCITVYAQSAANQRTEQISFTPNNAKQGQTWVMAGADGILFADDERIRFLAQAEGCTEYNSFTNPDVGHNFRSVHYGWTNETADAYSVYVDEEKMWVDTRNAGKEGVSPVTLHARAAVNGFAGNYFYSVQYKKNLLSRLTYWYDVRPETNPLSTIWLETFDFQRVKLDESFIE